METTAFEEYGTESGNAKCANCMVHCGYEPSAVNDTFSSLGGFMATVKATLFNSYKDPGALALLNESAKPVHGFVALENLHKSAAELEETNA